MVKKILKYFSIICFLFLLPFIVVATVYVSVGLLFGNNKMVIKSNLDIKVPEPESYSVFTDLHPDSNIFYIYSFKKEDIAKIISQLTNYDGQEELQNNLNIFVSHLSKEELESYSENFNENILTQQIYYKLLITDRRINIGIFDIETYKLYFLSTEIRPI